MGGRQINLLNKINMNKFLAVVCLAAGAVAEAEADTYYAAYGYAGLPVSGAYGAGVYGAGAYGAGVYGASAYGAGVYGAGVYGAGAYGAYGAYPYGLGHAAGYASVSPSASVSINGLAPAAVPAVAGGYAGAGRYVANSAGVVHVAKREAEAKAEPYYAAYGYAGLPVAGAYAGAHVGAYAGAYGAYGAFPYAAAYGAYPYAAAYGAYPYAGVAATNAAVGHAVAYTALGAVHSSHVGVCTNNLGAQVPC